MKNKVKYVLGFMFSEDNLNRRVALIKKTKPTWQAGRLNGIGGKIERNEYPADAMIREFFEETGFQTKEHDWTYFASMTNSQFIVYCYVAYGDIDLLQTTTEEKVTLAFVNEIAIPNLHPALSNIRWLIPMGLDCSKFEPVEIVYHEEDKYIEHGNR